MYKVFVLIQTLRRKSNMKTEWDYTNLADAYLYRPDYASVAIHKMLELAGVKSGSSTCDIGAGAAHLTLELAKYGLNVYAVEPNDAMRANGIKRTQQYTNIQWFEGTGEQTGMNSNSFDLVTFGSSFNVCNRQKALIETNRILKSGGYFVCMWNHRDLNDPLQHKIEQIIKHNIPDYTYGSRREDQTEIINQSGLFDTVQLIEGTVEHHLPVNNFIEGWKSHGTVYRQSPHVFQKIISEITELLTDLHQPTVTVPYTTRIWMAQTKK